MTETERTGPRQEAGPTITEPSVQRRGDPRGARVRRWARLELDVLLDETPTEQVSAFDCDGRHHAGVACDWWGACTGFAAGIPERAARSRDFAMAGWAG